MAYYRLGPRPVTAMADTTGFNPGNWTAQWTPQDLAFHVPTAEVYHIVINSGPAGSTFTIAVNDNLWDANNLGTINGWDPAQPILLEPGDYLYIYWNSPATGTPPKATLWLRSDVLFGRS